MGNKLTAYYIVPLYNVDSSDFDIKILPAGYHLISNQEFLTKYRA